MHHENKQTPMLRILICFPITVTENNSWKILCFNELWGVYCDLFSLMRRKGIKRTKEVMKFKHWQEQWQISLHVVLSPPHTLQYLAAHITLTIHTSSLNDWLWNGTFKLHAVLKWFSSLPWCLFCYGNSWYINITSTGSEQKIMNPGGKKKLSPPLSVN